MSNSQISSSSHETRRQIMEATFRAISKHGYADLRMRHIGSEFEKTRQVIHYHYDGKHELISAFLEYLIAQYDIEPPGGGTDDRWKCLHARIDQCLFGPDIEGVEHWERMKVYHELYSQAQHNDTHRDRFNTHYEKMVEDVAAAIEAGVSDGTFASVDPLEFAYLLTDVIHAARARRISLGQQEAPQQAREAINEFLLTSLVPNIHVEIPK